MVNEKIYVAPSILSADFSKMGEEVVKLEQCGADIIHIDVMDGVFVPNITFGIKMVKDLRKHTSLPMDSHLMIVEPWKYVEQFAKAGSDYITVHYEACGERLGETLELIKGYGAKCGLVINPNTPVSVVADIIPMCDMVLVMSVYPGFGGQKFIAEVLDKVVEIKKIINNCGKNILLEIDGGINTSNVNDAIKAGVNVVVAGSTVFNSSDMAQTISMLKGTK